MTPENPDLSTLTPDDFDGDIGSAFDLCGDDALLAAKLVAVSRSNKPVQAHQKRASFNLIFELDEVINPAPLQFVGHVSGAKIGQLDHVLISRAMPPAEDPTRLRYKIGFD